MLRALDKFQKESASKTIPWLLENIPPSYFRSILEEDRVHHLNAITALVGVHCRRPWTAPRWCASRSSRRWTTRWPLDIFRFGQQEPFLNQTENEKLARTSTQRFCAEIQTGKYAGDKSYPVPGPHFELEVVDKFLNHSKLLLLYATPSRVRLLLTSSCARKTSTTKQPFTVKITGGTDGDVADNVIKVLHHEYGNNKHLDGICDGTGVVEDPHGLDCRSGCVWRTTRYRCRASTGPRSRILVSSTISDTQEGIRARNSMRVKTDGKPSSGLIVEVANLFITPEARQLLSNNAGVVIVKESSANKCGVLCSSYEIVASMLLETDEFLSVKDELVVEIVDKLHVWARVEAQLLFRKYKKDPTSALPPASERISRAITLVHDAVHAHFDDVREADKQILFTLIEEHLPPKLRKLALDRVQQNVHLANLCSIVALSLVSKIEGLQFTEALSDSNLGNIALQDLKQEKKALRLVQEVRPWQLANKDDIADLLARGCVRAGMDTPNKIVP
ncbi:hypothetical protein PR003_g6351 [Phytophthora rubi]|uniref:Glutamate/phenylalanine/leucine/valine/L-tryptophan dehydrogenase C-terminal domain-containing protein n=1 Tax=Phytophthora rubi TaxID=129364 RepID=A0A6A4G2L7_9STRA|nr:hypothetical protein PR003_g6351 [Phytophthora rubi]